MFFSKKQPVQQQPIESVKPENQRYNMSELDEQIAELKRYKETIELQKAQENKIQIDKDKENSEAFYFKTLSDVETLVKLCEENGWYTSKEWKENNIPMLNICRELLKAVVKYSGWKVADLSRELKLMKLDERDR